MSFESFVCWKPENVDRVAPIDVASVEHDPASDASIFLATHQPLHLLRLASAAATTGELIEEHVLLTEFSRPVVGNDPQVTVISGAVGTGKSHMVKWLHSACAGHTDWHQVYIEKRNTSLRRVIETILAGLAGPRVSELREQLKLASNSIRDLPEAKSKVLHELAHRVQFPTVSDSVDPYEVQVRRQLPHILDDPVLKQHLLREEGALHRITRLGYEGLRLADDNEHDLYFRDGDLPLSPADLLEASAPAQQAIRQLASHQRLRSLAIEILNRELAAAKAAVFIGTGIDLTSVFDEVREEIARRGLELVLYIEDLVVIHGIDRELAQVFTEGKGQAGDRCVMRVVIAVTDGELASGFETLTSRARHYSLNLRLGDHVSRDQSRTFVGRYLNAIRVGASNLRDVRTSGPAEEWVPNACDTCDFREECHAGFGADANDYGFYPLNDVAVDRLVRLVSQMTNAGRFDAREVLRHVVRDPLDLAAAELPDGRFPSKRFAASLDNTRRSVSTEVRTSLDGTSDGDRRIALLGFWASEPVNQITNLDAVIHTAFRLPEFSGADRAGPPPDPEGSGLRPRPRDWPEVEAWANEEKVLPSPIARTIRQFIFDAVLEQVRSGPTGLRVSGTNRKFDVGTVRFELNSINIEAAQGGGAEVERPFSIEIERSARMAVILKALLTADRERRWPSTGDEQFAEFVGLVERWADELANVARCRAVDLDPAIRLLALTSQPGVTDTQTAGETLEVVLQARPDPSPRSCLADVVEAGPACSPEGSRGRGAERHVGEGKRCVVDSRQRGDTSTA